jgi:hypothetical protein
VAADNSPISNLYRSGGNLPGSYPSEMRDLIEMVNIVRKRCLANDFFESWIPWSGWVLVALLVAIAFSPFLKEALISAGFLVAIVGAVAFIRVRSIRPSRYQAACQLDAAAGLADRLSTALHFGLVENPDEMILRQRRDALARVAHLQPRILFPLRMPQRAGRLAWIALIVGGVLAYRIDSGPSLTALIRESVRSNFARALLRPIIDIKRDILAKLERPTAIKDATQVADAEQPGALPKDPNSDNPAALKDPKNQDSQTGQDTDQPDSNRQDQADANQQGQASLNSGNEQGPSTAQDASGSQSAEEGTPGDQPSLTDGVLQLMKGLLKDAKGQPLQSQDPNSQNQQPSPDQPSQASAKSPNNASQPGSADDKGKGQAQPSDKLKNQQAEKKPSSGVGNRPGSQQSAEQVDRKTAESLNRERVGLDANKFREQGFDRIGVGPGTASVPLRNIAPQPVATTNGAGQEDIPLKYRFYVQRYFDHGHTKLSP